METIIENLKCARNMYILHKNLNTGCASFWANECKRLRDMLR